MTGSATIVVMSEGAADRDEPVMSEPDPSGCAFVGTQTADQFPMESWKGGHGTRWNVSARGFVGLRPKKGTAPRRKPPANTMHLFVGHRRNRLFPRPP